MSPRNTRQCPKCRLEQKNKLLSMAAELKSSYAKVPLDTFEKMQDVFQSEQQVELDSTLAEYYEFSFDDNLRLRVRYSCECGECGFSRDLTYEP